MTSDSPERIALLQALRREGREFSLTTVFFHQLVAERLGLSPTDHRCADILSRSGPVSAGELAERTGLTTGAITGVVDRLERAGLVRREKDPNDRRRVIVRPAWGEEREQALAVLFEPVWRGFVEICESYTDGELRLMTEFLSRFRTMAQEEARKLRTQGSARTRGIAAD